MSRIKLTIKTLDSRNHLFEDLSPEMSVRELKKKISPSVDIPPERQRLIYCGRVLDDDRKLKDHALDGKVLHLVSRLPRGPTTTTSTTTTSNSNEGPSMVRVGATPDVNITIHHAPPFRATVGGGGSNPVRAELPRSSATIRLQLASRMLRRANGIIDALDNPGREEETTTTTSTSTNTNNDNSSSSNSSGGADSHAGRTTASNDSNSSSSSNPIPVASASGEIPSGAEGNPPPGSEAASDLSSLFTFNANGGETVIGTMAIQIETNGEGGVGGTPAVFVQNEGLAPLRRIFQRLEQQQQNRGGGASTASTSSEAPNSSTASPSVSTGSSATTGGGAPLPTTSTTATTSSSSSSRGGSSSESNTTTAGFSTIEHPPPSALALVMEEYNRTNARLAPHTERMITLLREDPQLEESVVREHQVFYNNVTQALHFMSHAQHAMSDILFNLSTTTPRVIRARPFLLHRPAFQNVAISATATPVMARSASSPQAQQRPPAGTSGEETSTGVPGGTTTTTTTSSSSSSNNNNSTNSNNIGEIGFTVEAQPIIVGIPSVRPGNNRAFIASETDFISNMIRATLGGIQNAAVVAAASGGGLNNSTTSSSSSSSSSSTSNSVNSRGSQRSSSDMNSGTQPTTSTRTRSSPHVHYAAATPMSAINSSPTQMGHLNNFDPFLQCNSHHILEGGSQSGGVASGVSGRWPNLDHHPIRRRTRHPAGFQIHHGVSVNPPPSGTYSGTQRSSSVPPRTGQSTSSPGSGSSESNSTPPNGNSTSSAPPSEARSALAQGIRELVLNQVMNLNNAPSSQQPQQQPQFNDDQVVFNIIQGILRYFVGALDLQVSEGTSSLSTVSTGNETMEQFLRSLPDYNYVEGESVLTDLLMTIIRHLTFRDLVTWIFGGGDRIISQLREPLATFVRGQLNTSEQVEESVQQFLDSYYSQLEEISNLASVSPDIDFAETLANFMSERLVSLVQIILRENNVDSFGRDISRHVSEFFMGLTALGMHAFTDGPASIERVVQNQLGTLCGHGLGPVARDQLMSIATGHLRNYIGGLESSNRSQEDISHYIIKKGPDAERRKSERNKRIAALPSNEDERFVTPPSSPERMDVVEEEESSGGARGASIPTSTKEEEKSSSIPSRTEEVPPVDPNQKFPSELLKMAQGPDMVIGAEAWHKSLPSEWVPIITRDVSRQSRSRKTTSSSNTTPSASTSARTSSSSFAECTPPESFAQAPFSDAYLSSQSAKRRKLTAGQKPSPGAELSNVIAESLNEALSETGVVTLVDVDTIAGSPDVLKSVELKTKNVIKEKLSQDLDFANSPEHRFRSSKAFSSSKD